MTNLHSSQRSPLSRQIPPRAFIGGRLSALFRRRVTRWLGPGLVLLLLLQAGACTSDTPDPAPVLPSAPILSLVERVVIGRAQGLTDPIGWVVVAPAGEIYVGHPLSRQVAAFDAAGRSRGRIGGSGRAEGEFERMVHAGTLGDSLWVYDGLLRRVTIFDPELKPARFFSWPPPADQRSIAMSGDATVRYLLSITPEGRIVSSVYRERGWSLPDSITELVVVDEGSVRTPITDHPVPPAIPFGGGFELPSARLFPVDPVFATATDGSSFVFIEPHVEGPDAGTFRVTRFNAVGDTMFTRRHPFYPVAIPPAVEEEAIRLQIENLQRREEATPGIVDAFRDNVDVPPVFPPVLSALPGRDGSTWIRMHPLVEGNTEYYVLDNEGGMAGRLSVPGALEIVAAEMTRVWAVGRNSSGAYRLTIYDVTESALPSSVVPAIDEVED